MAIVQNINNVHQFREAFRLAGRMDQFSHEGLEVLFDYLDNLSEGTGESIELDAAGMCCEYYELSTEEIVNQYNLDTSYVGGDDDAIKEMVREYLEYRTSVCGEVANGFVYAAF